MPPLSEFRPGCEIFDVNGARGTLTCFAIKRGQQGKLYGVTARHCAPQDSWLYFGAGRWDGGTEVGGPAVHAAAMDVLYFEIDESVKQQLAAANFRPVGLNADVTSVWNPDKIRTKMTQAASAQREDELKGRMVQAQHLGGTSTWTTNATQQRARAPIAGEVVKHSPNSRTQFINTTIAPGDSGGPVIDQKQRYVGLVSMGDAPRQSATGLVVLLQDAFDDLGLELATWHNRALWQ